MTTQPPLLKPRHGDGRPYTADEIRGADAEIVRQLVGVCVMGWRWARMRDNFGGLQPPPRTDDGDGWHPTNIESDYDPLLFLPTGISPFRDWYRCGMLVSKGRVVSNGCPDWPNDIDAAFTVDRPDWRWEMEDYDRDHCDVMVVDKATANAATCTQLLGRKATPQDYARARCVAALLLAAKIGE